jgi:hypothetical protein
MTGDKAGVELAGPQRLAESREGDPVVQQQTVYADAPAPGAMPPDTGRKRTRSNGRAP